MILQLVYYLYLFFSYLYYIYYIIISISLAMYLSSSIICIYSFLAIYPSSYHHYHLTYIISQGRKAVISGYGNLDWLVNLE